MKLLEALKVADDAYQAASGGILSLEHLYDEQTGEPVILDCAATNGDTLGYFVVGEIYAVAGRGDRVPPETVGATLRAAANDLVAIATAVEETGRTPHGPHK